MSLRFAWCRLAAGGARGQKEARRMVIEKTAAGVEAQAMTISGIIAGNKTPLLLPKSFESCRNGFAPTNADRK
jgi:hypothetical protein